MESVKRLASTVIAIVSTRLDLLANELQEERLYISRMFMFFLLALFFFGVGIMLSTVFIVVLFWDDHRLVVLGGLSLAFFVLATFMAILVRNKAKTKSKLFSVSIAEFAKDSEHLGVGND